jgi:putative membrane-bound dehydrogenase-like protein
MRLFVSSVVVGLTFGCGAMVAAEPVSLTGPATEARFKPLKLPVGFKATLFACDPFIAYPSVIAAGPRPGSLFVAIDYMTGLGEGLERRSEVRLIEDTDGDGYADKSTVFADKLNSVQGVTYHDGTLYVMHAPYLTAFRDTKGKGVADERRDLFTGFGLAPEQDKIRLHNANGVVAGHDGWLYLALGDHGCDVRRPEGDRLILQGGGILRCRPDGRDLHIFARGLRNIYDVALDEDLNVFVRDNENDGGTYMIRVCHSFFGADHGYPYLYQERPDEALRPLADLGLGSSAGGVCYQECAFPKEYRGNLFFCEWGRSVVRYPLSPAGSSFAPVKEVEFASGAEADPYGFKPTDVVVPGDGSLIVSDWADGQRPRRGRGRIYRITYKGDDVKPPAPHDGKGLQHWLAQLDSESLSERLAAQAALRKAGAEEIAEVRKRAKAGELGVRASLHAVWILAGGDRVSALDDLFTLAEKAPEPRVRAQAVRALADLVDPVLVMHRLDAAPGDVKLAARFAALGNDRDPRVRREIIIALGRLQWSGAPVWLADKLKDADPALAHAAMQTLRRSRNWPEVLKLLDAPANDAVSAVALRALSGQFEPAVVDGLLERLKTEKDAGRRRQYADAVTRVVRKPGPWGYWGFRPAPRPANTVIWERTVAIEAALDRFLGDADVASRLAIVQRMEREKIVVPLPRLATWLSDERDAANVASLLESLREHPAKDTRGILRDVIRKQGNVEANRLGALGQFIKGLEGASEGDLLDLAQALEAGPVLAEAVRELGRRPTLKSTPLLKRLLEDKQANSSAVRAAALHALAELKSAEARQPALDLLDDADVRVRAAAAFAAGRLDVRDAADRLLKLAESDTDAGVRRASLEALRIFRDARVVPVAAKALNERITQGVALDCLVELGGPEQTEVLVKLVERSPSPDIVTRVARTLTSWSTKPGTSPKTRRALERALAEVQGSGALLLHWRIAGPVRAAEADKLAESAAQPRIDLDRAASRVFSAGSDGRVRIDKAPAETEAWIAATDLNLPDAASVQFQISGGSGVRVILNGKVVHTHEAGQAASEGQRFTASFAKGANRVLVRVAGGADFALRFRRQSLKPEHEALMRAALGRRGSPVRGSELFKNAEKSQCLKCHRLGNQGERIGPELTGVGTRYARAYLIESILEPSRTIAPSFDTVLLILKNGKTLSGIQTAETPLTVTIADVQGLKQTINKADIEERQTSPLSTMPEGLEKRFTEEEFIDLIEFLVSQKETRGR